MIKLTDSNTFKSIESTITDGKLFEAMKELNELALSHPASLITVENCKALHVFLDAGFSNKLCPGINTFKNDLADGKIKLVYAPSSKLQTLVYAFPIVAQGKGTYLLVNATHFFSAEEQLTDTGTRMVYSIKNKDDNYLSELANVCLMVLATADNPALIHNHVSTKKELMNLYSVMLTNVIARQSTIGSNKDSVKVLRYYTGCFFLKHVMHTNTSLDVLGGLAANQADLGTDAKKAADLKITLSSKSQTWCDSISDLLEMIKEVFPSVGDLTLENLINQYNISYTPCSVLSIDYLPYLVALYTATGTKNIIFGGASFRNKMKDISNTAAIRTLNEIF